MSNDPIREQALADEKALLEQLGGPPPTIDPATERTEFAELLAFLKAHPDEGTAVEILTLEEFSQDAFTPPGPSADEEPSP